MSYYTVTIPVKTYVRKYIESRNPQPMILSQKNYIGSVIYAYLEKKNTNNIIRKNSSYNFRMLTDKITVLIPKYLVNEYKVGLGVPMYKAFLINNLVEEKIAEDIHIFCTAYSSAGFSKRKAIEDFAEMHNIYLEIDISYAAFKKAAYRQKKTLKEYQAKLSPRFFDPKILI